MNTTEAKNQRAPLHRLLRWEEIREQGIWPFSRAGLHRAVKEGRFPQPVRCGGRVAWREEDLIAWQKGLAA